MLIFQRVLQIHGRYLAGHTHCKFFLFICLGLLVNGTLQAQPHYAIQKIYKVPFHGDWKYPVVNPFSNKLYITHGNQVSILNKNTGDSIGIIPNTKGVEGVALAQKFGKGYATNSKTNTVTVFDLKSDRFVKEVPVGINPDAIIYDGF